MTIEQSQYAGDAERARQRAPVAIRDCTLREAEQAVGLSLENKLLLARQLCEAGLGRIQVGAPGRSPVDANAIAGMKTEGTSASLEAIAIAYVPDWKQHVDACVRSGADVVDLVHPVSPIHLEKVLRIDRAQMLERLTEAVEYARSRGAARVVVSAMDAPRSSLDILDAVARTVAAAGADELIVCDSVGVAGPRWIGRLVGHLVERSAIPVGIHCHNDLGLALANTLGAIEAGGTLADVTINGLGERAGNACLDELVVALHALYHLDTGIDATRLTHLAETVSHLTGVALPFNKPLVGSHAFSHRHDTHARAAAAEPASIEPIDPASVGNQRRFLPGKYSGPFVVSRIADRLGLRLTDQQAEQLAEKVRQRATGAKEPLTDEVFVKLAGELQNRAGLEC